MLDDKNPFGNHPVGNAYQKFKTNINEAVEKGKMDITTALTHFTTLGNFATDKQHDQAGQYIKTHSEKLGFQPKEQWFKEENWRK